eukprot:gene22155-28262_t
MVHPRDYGGAILHPHERDDKIRPVQIGDKSKVVVDTTFYLSDGEVREEDYHGIRDLAAPNSLATNRHMTQHISNKACRHTAKYLANQIALFLDPHTGDEVYGRILSEWDYRHSAAAPAIIRGDDSSVCYIVQMLGLMPHHGAIEKLEELLIQPENRAVRKVVNPKTDDDYVLLGGLEHDPDRAHQYHAHIVDKRVQEMRNIQILGPKYHLRGLGDDAGPMDMYAVSHDHLVSRQGGTGGQMGEDDDQSILSDIRSVRSHAVAMATAATGGKGARQAQPGSQLLRSQTSATLAPQMKSSPETHVVPPVDQELLKRNLVATKQLMSSKMDAVLSGVDRQQYEAVNKNIYADVDTDSQSQLSITNDLLRPSPAVLRSYEDVINRQIHNSTKQGVAYYSLDHQRVTQSRNILVISEKNLVTVDDHLAKLVKRKNEVLRRVLECSIFSTDMMKKFKKFSIWKGSLEKLKTGQKHIAMTRIQSRARVWLCRNKLAEKTALWHVTLERQRQNVHAQFRYSDASDQYAVTMDNKIYFQTHADLNRYAAYLRLTITRIVLLQTRKRHALLRRSVTHWKGAVGSYLEENLVMSHFNEETTEGGATRGVSTTAEQKEAIVKKHLDVMASDALRERLQAAGDLDYDSVVALPLKVPAPVDTTLKNPKKKKPMRQSLELLMAPAPEILPNAKNVESVPLIENGSALTDDTLQVSLVAEAVTGCALIAAPSPATDLAPSYHPSEGIALPPLLAVFDPKSAEGRLAIKADHRLDYLSLRALMEGPSFESCWAVPERVAFGSMPWGPASGEVNTVSRNRNQVSAISALMLSGVDLFVSLLQPEEEAALEAQYGIQRIEGMTATAFDTARSAVNQILIDNTGVISKQQEQIDAIPKFGKSDPRFPAAYRETLRCKARIKLAEECIKRARSQIKNLSTQIEWMRIPLQADRVPTVNAMLPFLWQLERSLRSGRNIYLYSRDGHGRAGMMAALLLGRLYGLHPYEAIYRIQASHDSSKREEHRNIPITCPQLPVQRQLVTDVLTLANRVLESVSIRSQVDPETYVDNHKPRPVMYKVPQTDDVVVIQESAKTDRPEGVVRHKQSLYFEHELSPHKVAAPSPEVREARAELLRDPELEQLYDFDRLGQSGNVVRKVAIQRPDPAPHPTLPLLRGSNIVSASEAKKK